MRTPLLLALLMGCATPRLDPRPSGDGPIFPHVADYDQGRLHGRDQLDGSPDRCTGCHELEAPADKDNVPAGTPPACGGCHADWPHAAGWRAGSVHGEGLAGEDADRSACLDCHEAPGLVASTTFACNSCHASYPHAENWAEAGQHGVYAAGSPDPVAVCGSCHGAALEGVEPATACVECHESWPHSEDWAEPTQHGAAAQLDKTRCEGCHATAGVWNGGAVDLACARCHATYPHPGDWGLTHLASTLQVGEDICLRCHNVGDGPPTMVATCAKRCHGGEE